ncbi:MAG: hypothetical protein WAU01_01960 [Saprospiraceae bacterium]
MKTIYLILLMLGFNAMYAHNPDISSLMIYEQNGKSILLIKSSLTAFEGEVDFNFGKGAFKTPEEFNQLIIQHFQKNCFVVANGDTLRFSNPQVQLGHETNLFAELESVPKSIHTLHVKCALFKDMHHNQCELILTINGLPQKQYILNNDNHQEVRLKAENNKWVVFETSKPFYSNSIFLIGAAFLLLASIIGFFAIKRQSQLAI